MFRPLILIATVLVISAACISLKKTSKMNAIELCYNLSFLDKETGQIFRKNDSLLICYFEDMTLYREPYVFTQYNSNALRGDTMVLSNDSASISFRERRYVYYVYKNGAETGLEFDSLSAQKPKLINVDSIQKRKTFKEAKLYNITHDRLAEAAWMAKKTILRETYVNVHKPDDSYNDTSYFYFAKNKFDNVAFSLSKEADSLKKMKLVQVNLIYKAIPKGTSNKLDIPRREIVFKIKDAKLHQPDKLLALFEQFKKDSEKLKLK